MAHSDYAPSMFLTAHDSFNGRILGSRDLVKCGIVAAELAHLIHAGRLQMFGDQVTLRDTPAPSRSPAGADTIGAEIDDYVVTLVRQQDRRHSVRMWADAMGDVLFRLIADELKEQGVVREVQRRGLIRRSPESYPALDLLKASGPRLRLDAMVREPATFTSAGAVNVAIIGALGLEGTLLESHPTKDFIGALTRNLYSQMQLLVAGTAAAAAAAAAAVRR